MKQEEDARIAGAMKVYAEGIEARMVSPDAGRVWRKAEAYRKEMAMRRAMRSLVVMGVLGGLYAVAMLVWCVKSYLRTPDGKAAMALDGGVSGGVVVATVVLAVAMAAGAWFLMREGRRETFSI